MLSIFLHKLKFSLHTQPLLHCRRGGHRKFSLQFVANIVYSRGMATANEVKESFERLPTIARPLHYDIHLSPNLQTFIFHGKQSIDLDVLSPTNFLKLNCREISIKSVSLKHENGSVIDKDVSVEHNSRWETVTFKLPAELSTGKAKLFLDFEGSINDNMTGFYRSKYVNAEGKDVYMASTQFEPVGARRAFPCWDEPAYKATFDITLTVPKELVALCNTDVISEVENTDGTKTVKFGTSPLMSSYLVAFAVGDLEYSEDYSKKDNVRVRIYTLTGKKEQTKLAMKIATASLDHYGEYFNIPYVLPKCDLLAVPDFKMGAMENWGLVIFREIALVCDPTVISPARLEHNCLTVAHELAHMWFGDLVTMEWWTDLWLNEGYAMWMEHWLVDRVMPEFETWKKMALNDTLSAMELDGLKNSHPIEVPINDPEEIEEIFDTISYCKSSSVINMLYSYLGEEAFRAGMRRYFQRWQFKNAQSQDLFAALTNENTDVASLMNSWIKQTGFPLIKVSRSASGDGKTRLHLQQRRFFADGSEDESGTLWNVPITLCSQHNASEVVSRFLFTDAVMDVSVDAVSPNQWIKLNPNLTGFYRVQYSEEMLSQLGKAIVDGELRDIDRLNIVSDLFALVSSGSVPATQFLSLMESFRSETDFTVWSTILSSVGTLKNVILRTDYLPQFNAFLRSLLSKIGPAIGWDKQPDEPMTRTQLRSSVLTALSRAGHQQTIEEAKSRFAKALTAYLENGDETVLSSEIRRPVLISVAEHGGPKAFESLVKLHDATQYHEVRLQSMIAMGYSPDPVIHEKVLAFALSEKVRNQDLCYPFIGLTASLVGQKHLWNFFKENFDEIFKRTSSCLTDSMFIATFKNCCESLSSEEEAKDVAAFFSKFNSVAFARPLNQALENIRLNAVLLERNEADIKLWLDAKGYK